MPLTKKQFTVLKFLDRFIHENGYCPSFDEVRKSLGLASLATVHKHISTLERKGLIRRHANRSRSIEILKADPPTKRFREWSLSEERSHHSRDLWLPLLGRISAGRPLEAIPETESVSLREFVSSKKVFLLQVIGNSMIDEHICDGDFVVVESTQSAQNGETIVALIDDGEATLKKFYRENNGDIRLQPANLEMEPLVVKAKRLKIQGRVVAVLRKY